MVLRSLIHVFMRGKRVIRFWDCQGLPLKTKPFVYCELCIVYCVLCNVYCLLCICVLFILHSVDILCFCIVYFVYRKFKNNQSLCMYRERNLLGSSRLKINAYILIVS